MFRYHLPFPVVGVNITASARFELPFSQIHIKYVSTYSTYLSLYFTLRAQGVGLKIAARLMDRVERVFHCSTATTMVRLTDPAKHPVVLY